MGADIRAVKEATAVPFELLVLVERATFTNTSSRPLLSCSCGKLLIMVWDSLRLHTSPRDITMREEGLLVWSWQTKVERVRRGSRTIVCRASLSGEDWLSQGWALWRQLCQPTYFQSDFFLFEHGLDGPNYSTPARYSVSCSTCARHWPMCSCRILCRKRCA